MWYLKNRSKPCILYSKKDGDKDDENQMIPCWIPSGIFKGGSGGRADARCLSVLQDHIVYNTGKKNLPYNLTLGYYAWCN